MSKKLVIDMADVIQAQLPSLGFNNPLNPFQNDIGNGQWAASIAQDCAQDALACVMGSDEVKQIRTALQHAHQEHIDEIMFATVRDELQQALRILSDLDK